MNVSITEDATISRTRSEGGATVVRVDAIVPVLALDSSLGLLERKDRHALRQFYFPSEAESMRRSGRCRRRPIRAGLRRFVFAEELFAVFDKAEKDDHGGACEADEEHYFQNVHCEEGQLLHKKIVT
jgi:hypothetical protein